MPKTPYHRITWDPAGEAIPFLAEDGCLPQLAQTLRILNPDHVLVVTEAAISRRFGLLLREALPGSIRAHVVSMPSGEATKTLATLDSLARQALSLGLTRRSVVVSFGGGLVCNMAGMLAGTLFRGLRLVHVPTTLLAMHDTVSSLKQAVNIGGHKNLLGVYHRPSAIVCDVRFCKTQSREALQAAMIEIVKNAIVLGGPSVSSARELCAMPQIPTADFCIAVIESGIAAKRSLMHKDPYERREAVLFEYGHTVGHALESVTGMHHGQCVYWGMLAAAEVAVANGGMTAKAYQQHRELLALVEPVARPREAVTHHDLMQAIARDNKRGHLPPARDSIQMVLVKAIGIPVKTDGMPICQVARAKVAKAVRSLPFVRG